MLASTHAHMCEFYSQNTDEVENVISFPVINVVFDLQVALQANQYRQ